MGEPMTEHDTLLFSVAKKRKSIPQACAQFQSQTMKLKINMLKSATVKFDESRYDDEDLWKSQNSLKELMVGEMKCIKSQDVLNRAHKVLEEMQSIARVVSNLEKEQTSEMDINMKKFCDSYAAETKCLHECDG
ncbi:uncharacterized protein [Periplaneta americana]|uniref:uncharacterized protein n=1 Tax=Periplaneta americana TaxID=6978 RepID=UPI0037E9B910